MFGLNFNPFVADELNDEGQETSPASRFMEASKPVIKEVINKAAEAAAAVADDDLEGLRN